MRTIAVVQHKGGVGKTTIAVNLAADLAKARKRVLLIDLDPQGGATRYLKVQPFDITLADALTGRGTLVQASRWLGDMVLAVTPADLSLARLDRSLTPGSLREAVAGLSRELAEALELENTEEIAQLNAAMGERGREIFGQAQRDVVIVDTPPGWGFLAVNALTAADYVIAPAELKPLSLRALVDLVEMIEDVRREHNPKLELAGVVPSRVQRTRLSYEALEDLRKHFGGKVLPGIRESARVAEAPGFHKALSDYAPDSIGAVDFAALTRAVKRKVLKS